jgi:hypothetical protein
MELVEGEDLAQRTIKKIRLTGGTPTIIGEGNFMLGADWAGAPTTLGSLPAGTR